MFRGKSKESMDACDICCRAITAGGVQDHCRERHASILMIREACEKESKSAFIRGMVPGILAFLILSFTIVAFVPVQHQYLMLLALTPIIASSIYAAKTSQRELIPYEEALESVECACYYCGTPISRKDYRMHLRVEHRSIHRWTVASLYLLIGVSTVSALLSALLFHEYLSMSALDALFLSVGPGIVAALSWALAVEHLLLPAIERTNSE